MTLLRNSAEPLVSILMNCFNGETYLKEAIGSVLGQTYKHWELVFVDNHSTDGSKEIVDGYVGERRLKYVLTPRHMPLGEAREWGMAECRGDFVCFLDTDDRWLPKKLEQQVELMLNCPEIMLCYSSCYLINEEGKITGQKNLPGRWGNLLGCNLANYEVNFQTVMIRRQALEGLEKPHFEPALQFSPDYHLIMRILARGQAAGMEEKLVYYRKTGSSLTSKTIDRWGVESEYTYKQLAEAGLLDHNSSAAQRRLAAAKIAYYKAAACIDGQDYKQARRYLAANKYINHKYFFLYVASFVPFLWKLAHRVKK